MKKRVVSVKEGVTGELHGGAGTFNVLIDEDIAGAKHFSLLVNEMQAGVKGAEHSHTVEHAWYILSGRGRMFMEGKVYEISPEMAIFAPATVPHKIEVDEKEPLRYVVVYAPPGPEKQLKEKGKEAFK
ncbi:MAG: cupin domain-containing protein [Thermodesulfobacteriota bacterium]|nr:cupin domain-containing protein [Thermodesulfobacteriota bacterium]